MKQNRCASKRLRLMALGVVAISFGHSAFAQVINLQTRISSALINLGAVPATQSAWSIGLSMAKTSLAQQWFWYRVGSSGPESSISSISAPTITTPNSRSLYTTYNNGAYGVTINYLLTGSALGTGKSDVSESITITNGTAAPLQFHFFQYSDFDLGGAGGDTVTLGKNLRGLYNEADQTDGNTYLTETVVTPGANHGEAALFNTTLTKLSDGNTDNLSDTIGPSRVRGCHLGVPGGIW